MKRWDMADEPSSPQRNPQCLVCGEELRQRGLEFYDATMLLGSLCRRCYDLGPAGAGAVARKRAAENRALAACADPGAQHLGSGALPRTIREYADFLESLGERLAALDAWPSGPSEERPRQ